MNILLFRLEGLLQSWGETSHWDVRDTAYIPTKSAIIGLCACCLGWHRDDLRIIEMNKNIELGIRVDRQGDLMVDFHTVKGNPRLATAGGGYRTADKSTIVSRRYYLQDASFLVAIAASDSVLEMVQKGLKNPKYTPFLGRKACVPSVPIIPKLTSNYSSIEEAFMGEKLADRCDGNEVTVELDATQDIMGASTYRSDSVLSFENREFSERPVIRKTILVNNE